ncbi:hypothetical protein ACH3XW_30705 [Acanthocheilonema viteae]
MHIPKKEVQWMDGWMDGTNFGYDWTDALKKAMALALALASEDGKRVPVEGYVCFSHACMHFYALHPSLPSKSYTSPEAFTFLMPSPKGFR